MTKKIPYGHQDINEADIDAVVAILRSDFLTQGPVIPAFEKSVSDYCSIPYAISVNSATSALHIACLALGVGKNDIVWTSPITFVASANCALYCGATIDFVDINSLTYNINIDHLSEKLASAEKVGKLPKVLIAVHLCGQSCDMESIYELSLKYGFKVIEDASHAIGGKYKGEAIGNCRFSDIVVFSFHPVKIITTGEGGMVMTKNPKLAKSLRLFRSHGITNSPQDMLQTPPQEIWNYQQFELGFNYRMTDLQAALGLSQMARLDSFVKLRNDIAKRYDNEFAILPIKRPWLCPDNYSSYHLYVIRLQCNEIKKTQRQVYDELHEAGILVNLHYIPVYRQPYYEKMGFTAGYCPEAERYYSEAISIPIYSGLTESQQSRVIENLKFVLLNN
jgi:UDP-4-amino-4,6-dideoxy-N-acetyl-beta-L-altrosamine transaminase